LAWKNTLQSSFADALLDDHEALEELDGVNQLIGWKCIEQILAHIHSSNKGQLSWPPLLMFKILLFQLWYNLIDPALEK
jgi:hypothetical protein